VDRRRVCRNQGVETSEAVAHRSPIENSGEFTGIGIDILNVADVSIVDLLVVSFSICMTLSTGAKVQPNLSTFRSPAGFKAA
jgi:hypothetical protein